jgi:hypothetical protein
MEGKLETSIGIIKLPISENYSRWDRNQRYRREIIALLNRERKPVCIQHVANEVGCAWTTAKAILSDLSLEGKVRYYTSREGYGRLFMINDDWVNKKAAEKED